MQNRRWEVGSGENVSRMFHSFFSIVSQFIYSYISGDKLSTYDDALVCSLLQNIFVDKWRSYFQAFLKCRNYEGFV